ncbi:MAG: hypothetical protein KMY53_19385 [Desulfarculus sp.]|nr:transcriptional regulator [Pseudomonadota bacterium]MBV1717152.1 hypothetical protein [Desulfarculus sp.]MBU4573566.1 transcriptional regulator [Pseudomonadota bacterium]MBU4598378.1 transcriptional regulator [Pseudomonadota bacterium]MBV1740334.1 hypothetical protein [Desulfarculus sp.]
MPLTIRQTIAQMLTQGPWSALELAGELLLTRREAEEHLSHLRRSLGKDLKVTPAQCRACGYLFSDRRRLDAPGRCPACRGQRIDGPWFEVRA